MADLRVKHAAKPKPGDGDVYDIITDYAPAGGGMIYKPYTWGGEKIIPSFDVIISDQSYSATTLITQWNKYPATLKFNDFEDPRGGWTIYAEKDEHTKIPAITSPYGVLPSSYTKTYYTLNSIEMRLSIGWMSIMLYDDIYRPQDFAMMPRWFDGGNTANSYIKYSAELTRKSDGSIISITGTSVDFTVNNNVFIRPDDGDLGYDSTNGDRKGDVIIIETETEWEE